MHRTLGHGCPAADQPRMRRRFCCCCHRCFFPLGSGSSTSGIAIATSAATTAANAARRGHHAVATMAVASAVSANAICISTANTNTITSTAAAIKRGHLLGIQPCLVRGIHHRFDGRVLVEPGNGLLAKGPLDALQALLQQYRIPGPELHALPFVGAPHVALQAPGAVFLAVDHAVCVHLGQERPCFFS